MLNKNVALPDLQAFPRSTTAAAAAVENPPDGTTPATSSIALLPPRSVFLPQTANRNTCSGVYTLSRKSTGTYPAHYTETASEAAAFFSAFSEAHNRISKESSVCKARTEPPYTLPSFPFRCFHAQTLPGAAVWYSVLQSCRTVYSPLQSRWIHAYTVPLSLYVLLWKVAIVYVAVKYKSLASPVPSLPFLLSPSRS